MAVPNVPKLVQKTEKFQRTLKRKPEQYWQKRGDDMVLQLFHDMSKRVPAYKDFLEKNEVNPRRIRKIEDLATVPVISKDNYLRQYSREQLCWDGNFADNQWVISTTSGSTGEPYYFPRNSVQDDYYTLTAELYLRENFRIHERKTLYIDAFAMGAWIGGVFTYDAVKNVAKKGYALSVITPGINKAEVISAVRRLGDDFDQVIIGCYPPILKDIIDLGIDQGVEWGKYNLGIVFSAEGFSEDFRDYIIRYARLADPNIATLNHYGTVDLGTMSHETAPSIMIRRQAVKNQRLFKELFGGINKQPTFTQYVPEMFYFEAVGNGLVCSSYSGLPLVRYDLKDNGGIMSWQQVDAAYRKVGKDLKQELKKSSLDDMVWNLPFVYVYERSDFSVTYSGAQIYPEEIRRALFARSLQDWVTGKFTMRSGYDKDARNFLEINVELKNGVHATKKLAKETQTIIIEKLLKENSEYRVLYAEDKLKLRPEVQLWTNGHPLYFAGTGKQRWTQKVD